MHPRATACSSRPAESEPERPLSKTRRLAAFLLQGTNWEVSTLCGNSSELTGCIRSLRVPAFVLIKCPQEDRYRIKSISITSLGPDAGIGLALSASNQSC